MYRPLADEIRPLTLDEVYGQKHILGENGLLRRIIASGQIPNMILNTIRPSAEPKTRKWRTTSVNTAHKTRRPVSISQVIKPSFFSSRNVSGDMRLNSLRAARVIAVSPSSAPSVPEDAVFFGRDVFYHIFTKKSTLNNNYIYQRRTTADILIKSPG